ncbi:MAG: hypothetical protein U1D97_06670 [Desulfuromonadales bacterium]|nr:hypothetical protein [Desulfuromonadales bacterium]
MTPYAVAILLRGSLVAPALVAVQLRLWERWGHAAILLSTGEVVEASAWHNEVLVHYNPCPWWNYEMALSLEHLGMAAQTEIARIALAMQGWKYDWRNGKGHALAMEVKDDPRRVLCFELVAISTGKFMRYGKPASRVTPRDICNGSLIHDNLHP